MSVFFSIVTPVYRPKPSDLQDCIDSVLRQGFADWELILSVDGPQDDDVDAVLERSGDPRIKLHRRSSQGGIVEASNDALSLAVGEFVVLLDNDDMLADRALETMASELRHFDDVDIAYSDWDLMSPEGKRLSTFHKPAWSPERLRVQMYVCHLGVFRRSLVTEVGGFTEGMDGAQDHDLALRVGEKARRVVHVPQTLYYWRQAETSVAADPEAKPWAFDAGQRAVQAHLDRTGFPAEAEPTPGRPGLTGLKPKLTRHPLVSIVIPTGGATKIVHGSQRLLVENAVASVVALTTYPNYEVVVVIDSKNDSALGDRLVALDPKRVRCVYDSEKFNFAGACNLGAVSSSGAVLCFLNDDTEVKTPTWLESLVMYAERPTIGAVGVRLEYSDGRIQHAGVGARNGAAGHLYPGYPNDHPGYFQALWMPQNVLAVTGACLAVEASKFNKVGGFSLEFPLNYNDVDLCFKLTREGWGSVVDCSVQLVHHESASRDPRLEDREYELLHARWSSYLYDNPYDNPNLHTPGVEPYPPTPPVMVQLQERLQHGRYPSRAWPFDWESRPIAG